MKSEKEIKKEIKILYKQIYSDEMNPVITKLAFDKIEILEWMLNELDEVHVCVSCGERYKSDNNYGYGLCDNCFAMK